MTMRLADIGHRRVLGISLSDTVLNVPSVGSWPLAARSNGYETWEAVRAAFRELGARVPPGTRLAVALLPPFSAIRSVQLPKMRQDDLHAVVSRNSARYFPGARDPQAVTAVRTDTESNGECHYVVAAASMSLLVAIERAANDAGLVIDRFVPAHAAWATMAEGTTPYRRTTARVGVRRDDGGIDVIRVANGIPQEVRRSRPGAATESRHEQMTMVDRPADAAALFAVRTRALRLMTNDLALREHARARTRRIALAAAAVVLLCAGAGAMWWRTRVELRQIVADRRAIASKVEAAQRAQRALLEVNNPAVALARVEEHGARWSVALARVGEALPPTAYVDAVRASGDSLVVDAVAQNGAQVFAAVATGAQVGRTTPIGPIRRDPRESDDGDPLERFTLLTQIPGAVPLAPPPVRGRAR